MNDSIVFLGIFLTSFICLILFFILFKQKTKIIVLTAVILSSSISGFIAGISNQPASSVLIPVISGFIAIFLPLLLSDTSNQSNQENDNLNKLKKKKVRNIGSLLIIFLIVLLPVYLSSNYLRFNCDNFLGSMGFGAEHCKDSLSKITKDDLQELKNPSVSQKDKNKKPKMAKIRCEYIGIRLVGCEEFVDSENNLKKQLKQSWQDSQ